MSKIVMFFKFSRLFLSTLTSLKAQTANEFGWFRDPTVKSTVYTNKAPSNGLRRGRPVKNGLLLSLVFM